jgi:hypothetical protein
MTIFMRPFSTPRLLPFVPGLAAVLVMTGINHGINAPLIGVGVFFVLVFVGTWALNERARVSSTAKIQELATSNLEFPFLPAVL